MLAEFRMQYYTQLATEAVVVGGLFVPWSLMWGAIIRNAPGARATPAFIAFMAGASFHLVAEATGLNAYYLHNSAAHMRDLKQWHKTKAKTKGKECGVCFR
jgi:hypothetical protein